MPISAEYLLDTSVAIPLVLRGHRAHAATLAALPQRDLGLAGHAAFETFSVLTRLPEPARLSPAAASEVIRHNFPSTRYLTPGRADELLSRLGKLRVTGGAVYDALVGAAALAHGCRLVTRDRRAVPTYRDLGVDLLILDDESRSSPG